MAILFSLLKPGFNSTSTYLHLEAIFRKHLFKYSCAAFFSLSMKHLPKILCKNGQAKGTLLTQPSCSSYWRHCSLRLSILLRDFNHLDICWERSTVRFRQTAQPEGVQSVNYKHERAHWKCHDWREPGLQ